MGLNEFRVIILKASSEYEEKQDPYVQLLTTNGYPAITISTLDFKFKNLDLLSNSLEHPEYYSGIIVNSPRCARAIIESFNTISEELLTKWKMLKCYVVGNTTGRLLSDTLKFIYEGNDCGNLSSLMELISKNHHENPLLMPVGNLHKSQDSSVKVEKIEVYETIEHPRLKENLCHLFENNDIPLLITFFSPSGVKSALPYIKQYPNKALKFIALGPTSAQELDKCHLNVDGICAKPTPENLVEVIAKIIPMLIIKTDK